MKTLLEKAKSTKVRNRLRQSVTPEEIELAVAWAKDEIGITQASAAIYGTKITAGKGAGVYMHLARALRQYIREQGVRSQ